MLKLVSLFIILLISSLDTNANETIKLTTHNLEHYGKFEHDSQILPIANKSFKGEAIDTVRCAIKGLPYQLLVEVMPWKRAQHKVEIGKAHGFFAASQNTTRDKFAVLSHTIADQEWRWYFRKGQSLTPQHPDFKKTAVVAAFNGANMKTWLENNNYIVGMNALTSASLLKAIEAKRLDAILANDKVMNKLLSKNSLKLSSLLHSNRPLGVYFSKVWLAKHPDFLTNFNQNVDNCRAQK